MFKHNDFDCSLVGLRLFADGWVRRVSNLNNPVSRAASPELGGMPTIGRRLNIDLKSSDLCCFYEHQLAFTVTRPSR